MRSRLLAYWYTKLFIKVKLYEVKMMTTLTYTTRARRERNSFQNGLDTLKAAFFGIKDGLDMARRYQALSSLSNAELGKRGLTRSDIPRAVVLGEKFGKDRR